MVDETLELGGTYTTGLISIAEGSSTATVDGALMTTQAIRGDFVYIPSQKALAFIHEVTGDETVVLELAWDLPSISDEQYILLKTSWFRYDPAITQAKIRELLSYYEGFGYFYFVKNDEPDPAVGKDGQFALKVNEGPWRIWYHENGEWVEKGVPVGIQPRGPYDPATTYVINDVVYYQGKIWRSLVDDNVGTTPGTDPNKWEIWLSGGDRYDIVFFDTDKPASGELVAKMMPNGIYFDVGLLASAANAEVGATATSVYTFKKNGVQFATLTFAAGGSGGSQLGVFDCPVKTLFGSGDVFTMYAPAAQDATLSGVGGNLIGYR